MILSFVRDRLAKFHQSLNFAEFIAPYALIPYHPSSLCPAVTHDAAIALVWNLSAPLSMRYRSRTKFWLLEYERWDAEYVAYVSRKASMQVPGEE